MKSKSRRELIDELKEHKKASETYVYTIESQRGTIEAQKAQITVKDRQIAGLKESLGMLSDDKDVRYIKAPDRGTVIIKREIDLERVECSRAIYNEMSMSDAKDIMRGQIAKALINAGVVRFETRRIPGRPYTEVTARIDVIPWYALCERVVVNQTKGEITIERGREDGE